ncbi:NAD(P)/FAD-dependent oxidoreductase [Luedemannella flava]|uniref:Pyridine nucleotide-disulfide oxidoreductase domain-containing protein 2 n=1 Tax=Luedemannella flava TaxID=349316 RepID=A0ABN2LB28_9ACTN
MSADAVVIGAGHNGLVAANVLADAGWDVLVLEATAAPGGAVASGEITAPGYLSDLCSAFYPLSVVPGPLADLGLADYGLCWEHAPDVLAHLLPDGRAAVLSRDLARTAASVADFAPGDATRWRAAYERWLPLSDRLVDVMLRPFPPVRGAVGLLRRARLSGSLRLARTAVLPVRRLGAEMFDGEGATLLMAGCALHADLSPDDAGSGLYGWLLAMLAQQYGFPVPAGGASALTDALVARLTARGGRIEYAAPVSHVAVAHDRAVGVSTVDGRRFRARRSVVADVPAPALYLDLLDPRALPPRLLADITAFRWDGATVKVDWALSARVPWRNPALAGAGTVHLGGDLNGLARYSTALACGEVPGEPFVVAGQMTTADPRRSPPGTEVVWAYTHLPRRDAWPADEVAAHAERVEQVMADAAPGFGRLVVGRHVAGPGDLERLNPSLVGGAINGGTSAPYQQLFLRPVPGLGRADTPVDRLFLASASAHPGGGVHGAPGANAARAALARDRAVTGRLYAAAVGAAHRAIHREAQPSGVRRGTH